MSFETPQEEIHSQVPDNALIEQLTQLKESNVQLVGPESLASLLATADVSSNLDFFISYSEFVADTNGQLMDFLQESLQIDKSLARKLIENSQLWHTMIGSTYVKERNTQIPNEAELAALEIAEITISLSLKQFLIQNKRSDLVEKYFTPGS